MEELKYYTPDVSELYIGYECEADFSLGKITLINIRKDEKNSSKELDLSEPIWKPSIIEEIPKNIEEFLNKIRTPYLNKFQIEKEGWDFIKTEKDDFTILYEFIKPVSWFKVILVYYPNSNHLILSRKIEFELNGEMNTNVEHIFNGTIKSINEFRTLIKWLGI